MACPADASFAILTFGTGRSSLNGGRSGWGQSFLILPRQLKVYSRNNGYLAIFMRGKKVVGVIGTYSNLHILNEKLVNRVCG
jgi:hypothetical protein